MMADPGEDDENLVGPPRPADDNEDQDEETVGPQPPKPKRRKVSAWSAMHQA